MKLNLEGIRNAQAWQDAGIAIPRFDITTMRDRTTDKPVWLHFGSGNIFRAFIAKLQQTLLDAGEAEKGIIAAESFDTDIIHRIYAPHDNLSIVSTLKADGTTEDTLLGSVAEGIDVTTEGGRARLVEIFESDSLQMVSFTITEKGYALRDLNGEFLPVVKEDIAGLPKDVRHLMSMIAWLLNRRYHMCASPIALVSMDNCSHNGEKLRSAVLDICCSWVKFGLEGNNFLTWVMDENIVSFPWTMIDKITPRPAEAVQKLLEAKGVEDIAPIVTSKRTYIAPFVNAEAPQYLVVEDNFPNGRPPLEKAGVYMTTRDVVNQVERMKVTTCLNPLHTALAVYGCVLGYESIAAEMKDRQLKALVEKIGLVEGMPVVTDPGILRPEDFIREVIEQRLPNPFIPDTPQRIATDTSQKVGIRFGETIKAYAASDALDAASLTAIPLAIAGWLRYLLGKDDALNDFAVSADPMLDDLQGMLAGVEIGKPETAEGKLRGILSNQVLFGSDLYEAGLGEKIEGVFRELIAGKGAVRATLVKYLGE